MIKQIHQVKNTTKTGRFGEEIAKKYLENKGYWVISKNYHIRGGEIDLVMQKDGIIVFVEVKFRSGKNYGTGQEAITGAKKQKLIRSIFSFLAASEKYRSTRWQLDLIAISYRSDSHQAYIQHLPDILEE